MSIETMVTLSSGMLLALSIAGKSWALVLVGLAPSDLPTSSCGVRIAASPREITACGFFCRKLATMRTLAPWLTRMAIVPASTLPNVSLLLATTSTVTGDPLPSPIVTSNPCSRQKPLSNAAKYGPWCPWIAQSRRKDTCSKGGCGTVVLLAGAGRAVGGADAAGEAAGAQAARSRASAAAPTAAQARELDL